MSNVRDLTGLDFYIAATYLGVLRSVATAIPSICLSICLSRAATVTKQIKLSLQGFHHRIASSS